MPICAALIHQSLERLKEKLRAEACKLIQAAWFGINEEKYSNGLPIICHSCVCRHAKSM